VIRGAWLPGLVAAVALGQTPSFVVTATGEQDGRVLRLDVAEAPALEVLSAIAAAAEVPLNVDPGLLDELATVGVTVRRDRIVLDEAVLLLGLRLSLDIQASAEGVRVRKVPPSPEARRAVALAHVDHAMLAHPEPQLMPGLRYRRACLLLESDRADEASLAFTEFAGDFPGHELAPQARVLAVAAALRAGLIPAALDGLGSLQESEVPMPEMPGAELLAARVHAAAGRLGDALVHARKVAAGGRFLRERALAGLVAAEVSHRMGDAAGMLAALDGLPDEFDRTFRDLAPKAALARGLALGLEGDSRAALLHLRVALREVEPEARPVAAEAIASCLDAAGQAMPAWVALRQAEALETDPAQLRRMRTRRAEMEEALGAANRAVETCLGILRDASGPFPEADRVLVALTRCFVTGGRAEDARVALDALADLPRWKGFALLQLALLERRAGDPEKALRALARLEPGSCRPPGPTPEEVRTLRGDLLLELGDAIQAADVFRGSEQEPDR
jgi:hypothetical protein